MGRYFIQRNTAVMDSGGHLMQKVYIEQFPIPKAIDSQIIEIENFVCQLIGNRTEREYYEDKIDEAVASLYGLNEEEIRFIIRCQDEQYDRH